MLTFASSLSHSGEPFEEPSITLNEWW